MPLWTMRTGALIQKCQPMRRRGLSNIHAGTLTRENVLVRVLQRNRTNRIGRDTCKRTFIVEIGSRDYGGQEVPHLLSASQRPKEAGGVVSGKAQRCESPGSPRWKSLSESEVPRTGTLMSEGRRRWVPQLKQRANSSFSALFHPEPQWMNDAHLYW